MSMLPVHPAAATLASPTWAGGLVRGPVAIGMMVATAAVSAYSAYRQSSAQKAAAQYNQDVQKQNAQIAGMQAQSVAAQGQVQQDAYQRKLAALMGSQRAALAGTGVDINTGSALSLQEDTAALGAIDTAQMRQQTAQAVWQTRLQGQSAANQAQLYGYQAGQTLPWLGATSAALSSATPVAENWYSGGGRRAGQEDTTTGTGTVTTYGTRTGSEAWKIS